MSFFCHHCRKVVSNEETIIVDDLPICGTCHSGFLEEITDSNRQEFRQSEASSESAASAREWDTPMMRLLRHGRHRRPDPDDDADWTSMHQVFRRHQPQRWQQQEPQQLQQHQRPDSREGFRWLMPIGLRNYYVVPAESPDSESELDGLQEHVYERMHAALFEAAASSHTRRARSPELALIQSANIGADQAGQQCTVCLEEFTAGESADRLPCQHHFHSQCIREWLKKCNSCPVCRKPLSSSRADEAPLEGATGWSMRSSDFFNALSHRHPDSRRYRSFRRPPQEELPPRRQQQQEVATGAGDIRRRIRILPHPTPRRMANPVDHAASQTVDAFEESARDAGAASSTAAPAAYARYSAMRRPALFVAERPLEEQQQRVRQPQQQELQEHQHQQQRHQRQLQHHLHKMQQIRQRQQLQQQRLQQQISQMPTILLPHQEQSATGISEVAEAETTPSSFDAPSCSAESQEQQIPASMSLDAPPTADTASDLIPLLSNVDPDENP